LRKEDQLPNAAVLITENTVTTEKPRLFASRLSWRGSKSFFVFNRVVQSQKKEAFAEACSGIKTPAVSVVTVFSVIRTAAFGNWSSFRNPQKMKGI
jgi:hypothetical protein